MDRLTAQWGNNHAVPSKFSLDFAFEVDNETWQGLVDVFDRLAAYEDTGRTPEEIAAELEQAKELLHGNCGACKKAPLCHHRQGSHRLCWEWRGPQKEVTK